MTKSLIKVLIVDDSRLVRDLLCEIISADKGFEVVGTAVDPIDARDKVKLLNPDVITLDIEMPKMDGLTFLKNLMRLRPISVVMISTLTEKGATSTLTALEIGAVDFVAKPKIQLHEELPALADEIRRKVKNASRANVRPYEPAAIPTANKPAPKAAKQTIDILAIGASTGGTEAIKSVLQNLPDRIPPVVIVQHMPAGFTTSFAKRLDELLPYDVKEFTGINETLKPGTVYLANGAQHMEVKLDLGVLKASCLDSAPVNRHKPSVDVLFKSISKCVGKRAIGVLLTGMGMDGAQGLLDMKEAGARTIVQDEQSSVVWGMPRVAVEKGAAESILPLQKIGIEIGELMYR